MADNRYDVSSLCDLRALSERQRSALLGERARYAGVSLKEVFAAVSSASSANSVSSAVNDWKSTQQTLSAETFGDGTSTDHAPQLLRDERLCHSLCGRQIHTLPLSSPVFS